ncbi:hypothetical protein Tco_1169450 [Tanacetum coccineum]
MVTSSLKQIKKLSMDPMLKRETDGKGKRGRDAFEMENEGHEEQEQESDNDFDEAIDASVVEEVSSVRSKKKKKENMGRDNPLVKSLNDALNDVKGKGKAIMKDKKQELTGIKEVDDLEQRIKNLEAIFSKLRDIKLKQKKVIVISDDDTSSDHDTSKDSQDCLSEDSSEYLINFLSSHDPQWQFLRQTEEEDAKTFPYAD